MLDEWRLEARRVMCRFCLTLSISSLFVAHVTTARGLFVGLWGSRGTRRLRASADATPDLPPPLIFFFRVLIK